jgi:class 3 adenylate cyclase
MARLTAKERAALPDRAFAYIDSQGQRRLPIHDAPHVRAALSRFNQVDFEDDGARDRARSRLLSAAKKHGIMPIGFVNGQLQPHRRLPRGQVTFLMSDVEGSTELLARLEDGYAGVLTEVRRLQRAAIRTAGGHKVDARADEFLAVFEQAPAAVEAALAIQRAMRFNAWPEGDAVRLRIGLHRGRPTLTENGYVGLSVHTVARICFAGHGGQVVVSAPVHELIRDAPGLEAHARSLGTWRFQGLSQALELFQVDAADLTSDFPPLRAATHVP